MKLLMVTPYLGSTYGGTSKIVSELVRSLGRLEIDVDLVTTPANDTTTLQTPLQRWLVYETHRLQYFPCWHRRDLILSPALARWLTLHMTDYDLVHTHTLFAPLISFTHWLCKLRRVPYVSAPHGMLEPWALEYKARKKRLYFDWFEKAALKGAQAIQATATPEADNIKALGFERTIHVSNGLHLDEYQHLPDPALFYQSFPDLAGKEMVLFLGRIDPKKGLDLLAAAWSKVSTQFPRAHLVVAGPDSIGFMPTAKGYFSEVVCLESVTFTGMLTGDLKRAALAAADVYVAPSYSEGFSMSVLEGMAAGLPCVITTGCNFPEASSAQVAHVVEIRADSIAQALNDCLADLSAAQNMGNRAREFVFDRYTWCRVAENLMQFYQAILMGTSSRASL